MFDVPPGAFFPPPKVTSAVVSITPLENPKFECERKKLELVARLAFGQRRKMLRASLKSTISEEDMQSVGIEPTRRPETLNLEEFCNLANLA